MPPDEGIVELHLVTSSEGAYQQQDQQQNFDEISQDLLQHNITFSYEFDRKIHNRWIETDTGWRIKPDRGLDIFQKPETWYTLGESDQTKRRCKQTEIDYRQVK